MTTIRRATEADRMALFKLCIAMHRDTDFRHYTLAPQKLLDALGYWIHDAQALLLVAERDGALIGFFMAKLTRPWFSDDLCAVEDCFFVLPEHRGSRAGYLLVRGFVDWAAEHQALHSRAGVTSGKGEAGGRLYEHFNLIHMGGNYIAHHQRESTDVLR